MKLTPRQLAHASELFDKLAEAQEALWSQASHLEELIGCEIDISLDLRDNPLAYWRKRNQPV